MSTPITLKMKRLGIFSCLCCVCLRGLVWFGLVVIIICGFGNYRGLIVFSLCVFSPCFFGQEIEVS